MRRLAWTTATRTRGSGNQSTPLRAGGGYSKTAYNFEKEGRATAPRRDLLREVTGDGKKRNAEEIENLRSTIMENFGTRFKQSLGIGQGRPEQVKQMTKREREATTMAMTREIST